MNDNLSLLQREPGYGRYSEAAASQIFTSAMSMLYGWIALGLVITGAVGYVCHQAEVLDSLVGRFGLWGYLGVLGVWLASIAGLSFAANRVPPAAAGGLYLAFTALTGLLVSYVWSYPGDSIIAAFTLTVGLFIAMSFLGFTTKRDLSGLGMLCGIGLLGVVIAGIANLFIGSGIIGWIVTLAALPIFLGLTAWDTKRVKELAQEAAMHGDEGAAGRVAIMGAVGLYLNFLNLFLILLRIWDFFEGD